jgi:predicted dehydrogenase
LNEKLDLTSHKIGRRGFLAQAAVGAAMLAYPTARVLGANDRVRIGLIGAGSRGSELLKQAIAVPNTEVVAVADVYTRQLEEAAQIVPGVRAFDDHRRLLDVSDIDAVIVATPLHLHTRHFLDTLSAHKDLYCEKTMTWSLAEAEQCRDAATKSKQVVGMGLQWISFGALEGARQWLENGLVGKVTQVDAWMSRNTPHGQAQWVRPIPSDCTAANVRWDTFLNGRKPQPFDPYKFINWRLFWEFSGGPVTELMVHQIAFIMTVLDLSLPTAAYMSGGIFSEKDGREVPDTVSVTLDFPNDLVVTWQSQFNNSHYGIGEKFLGSDGTIEHTMGVTDTVTGRAAQGIHYYPEPVNRPQGTASTSQAPDQAHMANFISCIRSRGMPSASVELGYRSAVAAHMANLAYRHKLRVTQENAKNLAAQMFNIR